jgi:aspartyl-tRNA(Asn)/glutamyl-tRNA(Gln) amidotransferase subunit A
MSLPHQLTVVQAARDIRERKLSPVALMEDLLARVDALEHQLKVWVTLDRDAAMGAARRADSELDAGGPVGPLHGIPIGIKDIYYTEGVRTTACSAILADFVPDYDATTVARLRQAGAIVMGKTVTTEFACGDPPPTRNPWNAEHTPGGSSSGSAVGVSVGMFPAALGSQTAGSVLRPAAFNGVVGFKPTFGRISRFGVVPVAWSLDTMGTFTRTVEDAALMLGVLAGHDTKDHSTSSRDVPDYLAAVRDRRRPPRIGHLRQFFHERATAETRDHVDGVVEKLAEAGATVEDLELPSDFETMLSAHRVLMTVEAAAVHQKWFAERADDYSPNVRDVIEQGMLVPGVSYVQAQRVRRAFRCDLEQALGSVDVLLTPTTATPAPRDLSSTGDPMYQTPFTFAGLPSVSLPSGLSASGLPFGIQLAAGPFAEETLLAAAHWCEGAIDARLSPPDSGS